MSAEIEKYASGLSNERHNALAQVFNPLAAGVQELIDTANTIEVTSVRDVNGMTLARETRLRLKEIRVNVEHERKTLKRAPMLEGKAIDGMANIIKFLIVPTEKKLQEKEDFVKIELAKRAAAIEAKRETELADVDIDTEHFNLAAMSQEAYESLLSSSRAGYEAKKKAEVKELERIRGERKAAEEAAAAQLEAQERLEKENAEIRKAADEIEKKAEAEIAKIEAEKRKAAAEVERLCKKEIARKEKFKAAELAKLQSEKRAEQARLAAPDREKLQVLQNSICDLDMPSVSGDTASCTLVEVRQILNTAVIALRGAIEELTD